MKKILIIGATSAIAEAAARLWAGRGDALFLVARSEQKLGSIAADLKIRGAASIQTFVMDACGFEAHASMLEACFTELKGLDVALIAHGTLSDQARCEQSVPDMLKEFEINALSVMSLASLIGNRLETQGHGTLAIISSVAGDRGRASNYVYGSAKAAVSAFASGMRQRLTKKGVNLLTIKPGFVDTPMTAAFKKGAAWATPAQVAGNIIRAVDRDSAVLYTPFFWRPIMAIIRAIPEFLFRKLKL